MVNPSKVMQTTTGNDLTETVRLIVNRHDPIRLIAMGAPDDEYMPEVKVIVQILQDGPKFGIDDLLTRLHEVFVQYFGPDTAGARDKYRIMAQELAEFIGAKN